MAGSETVKVMPTSGSTLASRAFWTEDQSSASVDWQMLCFLLARPHYHKTVLWNQEARQSSPPSSQAFWSWWLIQKLKRGPVVFQDGRESHSGEQWQGSERVAGSNAMQTALCSFQGLLPVCFPHHISSGSLLWNHDGLGPVIHYLLLNHAASTEDPLVSALGWTMSCSRLNSHICKCALIW